MDEYFVNIMFCATCENPVALANKKDKYFYTIMCLQIKDTDSYVMFTKIFKPLKRKSKSGLYFNLYTHSTQLLININDTNSYLNNFLSSFEEHKRAIADFNIDLDNLSLDKATLLISEWESGIMEHFNKSIIETLSRKL